MRHLEVLVAAGLVTDRKRGRERWHYINAVPLQQMYGRWVNARAAVWASGLLRLRSRVMGRLIMDKPLIDVALEVDIAAPPEHVFTALTEDPGGWWGMPCLRSGTKALTLDRKLGGHLVEAWDEGGAVLATITGWRRDRQLELTGPFHLGLALATATFALSAKEGRRLC